MALSTTINDRETMIRSYCMQLKTLWLQAPELRLGQLLVNTLPPGGQMFYTEDAELFDNMEDFIELVRRREGGKATRVVPETPTTGY